MTTPPTGSDAFAQLEDKLRGLLEAIVNSGSIESLSALISLMLTLLSRGHSLIGEAENALAELLAAHAVRMRDNLDRLPRPKG